MWRIWLCFSAGPRDPGAFAFGLPLLCLLIAVHDFALVTSIGALQPLDDRGLRCLRASRLRFWPGAPALVTGGACASFTIAALVA